jgi:hypothetical protein
MAKLKRIRYLKVVARDLKKQAAQKVSGAYFRKLMKGKVVRPPEDSVG